MFDLHTVPDLVLAGSDAAASGAGSDATASSSARRSAPEGALNLDGLLSGSDAAASDRGHSSTLVRRSEWELPLAGLLSEGSDSAGGDHSGYFVAPTPPVGADPPRGLPNYSIRKSPRLARKSGKLVLDLAMERKVALRDGGDAACSSNSGARRAKGRGDVSALGKLKRKSAKIGIKMCDADASLFLDFVSSEA